METLLMKTQQMMTSLEIAELTGKQHKHVMETIRKMEPAWEKVHGSKFRLMCRTQKGRFLLCTIHVSPPWFR